MASADRAVTYAFFVGLLLVGWLLFRKRRYLLAGLAVAIPFAWTAAGALIAAGLS